jgi:hypothetical protein
VIQNGETVDFGPETTLTEPCLVATTSEQKRSFVDMRDFDTRIKRYV